MLLASTSTADAAGTTKVSIVDGAWHLNGQVTYRGAKAEGLLMNVRMVNAVFDDPNRRNFDAEANAEEFIARIPEYVAHGVRAFTIACRAGCHTTMAPRIPRSTRTAR
jgi:hypothetical protein